VIDDSRQLAATVGYLASELQKLTAVRLNRSEVTMHRYLVRSLIPLTAIVILATDSAEAQRGWQPQPVGQLRFRLGVSEPAGSSDGWDRVFEGFTGSPADLQDFVWAGDFLLSTGRRSGVLFGFSYYSGSTTSGYEDWVADDGSEIRHTTSLTISDLSAAWVFRFSDRGISPYLGIGGGFLWWTLTDEGYFIDFGSADLPVFWAWYGARGSTWEVFGLAGVDIPLSPVWSFVVEGRDRHASANLGDDYSGFGTLDLSGYEVTAGFGWMF
jgi:hypothetical protein